MRDTIDMAREAGFNFDGMPYTVRGNHAQLAHLEALVRADEREACAKVCEDSLSPPDWNSVAVLWKECRNKLAAAIRARGNT
jgi:hypothetical protein